MHHTDDPAHTNGDEKGQTVLVTGGAGYIGSHVCKALAKGGFLPVVYDNLSRGNRWAVRWGPFEYGDIGDQNRLRAVLTTHRPVAVIHLAAFAYVGESEHHPHLYYDNNVRRTLTMMDTLLDNGVERIIFSSSCAVYGVPETLPITEQTPMRPVNVYGTTKMMTELVLRDLGRLGRIRYCALRYFNAAGADADGEIGECHTPEPHVLPSLLSACSGGAPFAILGTDYDTPDGSCIRDYIHVTDLAKAHIMALDYLLSGGPSEILNLGTGQGISIRELIHLVQRVTGRSLEPVIQPRRGGDPPALFANSDKAGRILGWQPEWQQLEEVVASAWHWQKKAACHADGP